MCTKPELHRQIVEQIRRKCGTVATLPNGWLTFSHLDRRFVYIPGKKGGIVRFNIPCLPDATAYDHEQLATAVNETNKRVKFVKAMLLDNGNIAFGYDHRLAEEDRIEPIVTHIIDVLSFAADFFIGQLHRTTP